MAKVKECSFCGNPNHSSMRCFKKRQRSFTKIKQKPLRKESKTHNTRRNITADTWYLHNISEDDIWECYLKINKNCPKYVTKETISLEHVYPKSKYPELQFIYLNLKAACQFCNKSKLSNTVQQLAYIWPHIKTMIETPEWQDWETEISQFMKPELR